MTNRTPDPRRPEPTAEDRARPGFSYDKWYAENHEEFNKNRRSRYATDPRYRQKVLGWNQQSRNKKRKATEQERREEAKAIKVALPQKRWKRFMAPAPDGSATEYFTIGALSEVLHRSIQVIRLWESQGVIATTPHVNQKGDRLYTRAQIQEIHDALLAQGRLGDQGKRRGQGMHPFLRTVKFADGHAAETALYKVGVLAQAIDRTIVTIEQMEARGALPVTPFRGTIVRHGAPQPGYRLYTVEMIRAVRVAFEARNADIRGPTKRAAFYEEVLRAWTDLGVVGATLVSENKEDDA